MESEPQADPSRPCNRNLFPQNQDHRLITKQMLFTRFHVPTVRGVILEKLGGAFKSDDLLNDIIKLA